MLIGYMRVSSESTSGAKANRPELTDALAFPRPGDVLVVWKLDRLGRSPFTPADDREYPA